MNTPSTLPYGMAGAQAYGGLYKHSGRVTPLGAIAGVLGGLISGVILAVVYAYADLYIPIIYANVLLCIFFGAFAGAVPAIILRWGKVRNLPVAMAIALVVTLAGLYVCWVVWICAVIDRYVQGGRDFSMFFLLMHPQAVLEIARNINESGTWSLGHGGSSGGSNVSGLFLGIIWLGECIAVFVAALYASRSILSREPFCEQCNQWCGKETGVTSLPATDIAGTRQRLMDHRFTELANLGPSSNDNHWITLTSQSCANCKQLHTLTATEVHITTDRKGKESTNKKTLINKLLVTLAELDELRSIGKVAAPATAAPSVVAPPTVAENPTAAVPVNTSNPFPTAVPPPSSPPADEPGIGIS